MYSRNAATPIVRACCLVLVFTVLGCNRDQQTDDRTSTAGGTVENTQALRVTEVDLGRRLGADNRVTDETDDFQPSDTIYASVVTSGTAQSATLTARWTFEDGQVVDESSRTISPTGSAVTEFHISKPGGWPTGEYTLRVLLDGRDVQSKAFEVK